MTLTKAELAAMLYEEPGLYKREATELVESFFEELRGALAAEEPVKLSGCGNVELRDKTQRLSRNPKTSEKAPIIARREVTFRPGNKLRARTQGYAQGIEQQATRRLLLEA